MKHNTRQFLKLRRRSGGNTLVEMMLLLPILLGLSFGAVEYGYAMYIKHTLQGAAREGARASIVSGATASAASGNSSGASSTSNTRRAAAVARCTMSFTRASVCTGPNSRHLRGSSPAPPCSNACWHPTRPRGTWRCKSSRSSRNATR